MKIFNYIFLQKSLFTTQKLNKIYVRGEKSWRNRLNGTTFVSQNTNFNRPHVNAFDSFARHHSFLQTIEVRDGIFHHRPKPEPFLGLFQTRFHAKDVLAELERFHHDSRSLERFDIPLGHSERVVSCRREFIDVQVQVCRSVHFKFAERSFFSHLKIDKSDLGRKRIWKIIWSFTSFALFKSREKGVILITPLDTSPVLGYLMWIEFRWSTKHGEKMICLNFKAKLQLREHFSNFTFCFVLGYIGHVSPKKKKKKKFHLINIIT